MDDFIRSCSNKYAMLDLDFQLWWYFPLYGSFIKPELQRRSKTFLTSSCGGIFPYTEVL